MLTWRFSHKVILSHGNDGLLHIWSHGLWHGTLRERASCSEDAGAPGSFLWLFGGRANICRSHPCKNLLLASFCCKYRGYAKISPLYILRAQRSTPCRQTASSSPSSSSLLADLWEVSLAADHSPPQTPLPEICNIKTDWWKCSNLTKLSNRRLQYSCVYNYSLQYYMFGCALYVVDESGDVFILGYEDPIKDGLFLRSK